MGWCRRPTRHQLLGNTASASPGWGRFALPPNPTTYLSTMPKIAFEPCIPTRGTQVPAGPEWLHESKHDGYRLIVVRDGARVRLFTRNGHDWTKRYPLIVEAALKNRASSFVVDGEAVLLGVDGVSDFDGLHSRRHDDEVQLYAFDILALGGSGLRAGASFSGRSSHVMTSMPMTARRRLAWRLEYAAAKDSAPRTNK
jgi:ATP-dependent DNA ligase